MLSFPPPDPYGLNLHENVRGIRKSAQYLGYVVQFKNKSSLRKQKTKTLGMANTVAMAQSSKNINDPVLVVIILR